MAQSLFLVVLMLPFATKASTTDTVATNSTPEIFYYHGMGNMLSDGFLRYDDGRCRYISLNVLTMVPDTTHARPFSVMLPETPIAHWVEKDIMNCVLKDSIFIRIESQELKPGEKVGIKPLSDKEYSGFMDEVQFGRDDYLEDIDPAQYPGYFKVIYDYLHALEKIDYYVVMIEQEKKNHDRVYFTITYPEAKFYFINIPVSRIIDCMRVAGSFERIYYSRHK